MAHYTNDVSGVMAGDGSKAATFDRMKHKVARSEAISQAKAEIAGVDNVEERLEALERQEKVGKQLDEIKIRRSAPN